MRNRFFGIYYKHQSLNGYVLAVIVSNANEGHMIQIVTNEKSYQILDTKSVQVSFQGIRFDIHQKDITLVGEIKYGALLEPKKDIMSYYRYLPIECKHNIYSMYHPLSGEIQLDGKRISFDKGNGYIEGDQGRNFPTKYIWLNAIDSTSSLTLAIASIPLGFKTITGITCLIEHQKKEYRFGTYNFAKAKVIEPNHLVIKKGRYLLDVVIDSKSGHALKAPVKGNMIRTIHECPSVSIIYKLTYGDKILLEMRHPYASYEYVFDQEG